MGDEQQVSGVAGVFDRAAKTYDAVGVDWFGPIAAHLVDRLDLQPGERVLDVGCGRGAVLQRAASAVGPTGHVLGIDLAPGMVTATAADVAHLPYVEVRVADAMSPEVSPGSYDVVATSLVLFFLPDPAAAVVAWAAALVAGGRLGVTTFGPYDERWRALDELFTPYLPPAMLDARTSGRRGPFASDEGVEALLTGAGLADVRTDHVEVVATFTGPDQWLAFSWSHGQRAMWEAVPTAERPAVERRARGLLEAMGRPDGTIGLAQDVRCTLGRRD